MKRVESNLNQTKCEIQKATFRSEKTEEKKKHIEIYKWQWYFLYTVLGTRKKCKNKTHEKIKR